MNFYLFDEANAASPEIIKGYINSIDTLDKQLSRTIDSEDTLGARLALEELQQALRRMQSDLDETHRCILSEVGRYKIERRVSVREKFRRIVYWMQRYVDPIVEMVRIDGPLVATFDETERLLVLARERGLYNDLPGLERNFRQLRSIQQYALRIFQQCRRELQPLYESLRRSSFIAEGAAVALERMQREGVDACADALVIQVFSLRWQHVPSDLAIERAISNVTEYRPEPPPRLALDSEETIPESYLRRVWLEQLSAAIYPDLPVADLLHWLTQRFPEKDTDGTLAGFTRLVFAAEIVAHFTENPLRRYQTADVSSRLSLKNYRVLKNAQEHRELLLLSTKGESRGLGLVILRDNDRYPQFRETLKNLLCLSTISQDQMRAQLIMLAGFAADRQALNIREVFGDDYDRILGRKQKVVLFRKQQKEIELLVQASNRREALRGQLTCRWQDLRLKRQAFEQDHKSRMEKLTKDAVRAARRIQQLEECTHQRHAAKEALAAAKGETSVRLSAISAQTREFAGFTEDLARSALKNIQGELRRLEDTLRDAEKETRDKAVLKRQRCQEIVNRTSHAIAHFDRALITVLRQELKEMELASLTRLFNFDLLEQTVGNGGISLHSTGKLAQLLRLLGRRIRDGVYEDNNISLPLPAARRNLSELENVASLRERLMEEQASLEKCVGVLAAIEQRDSLLGELNTKRQQIEGKRDDNGHEIEEGLAKQLFRFEEYEKNRHEEPQLKAELKRIVDETSAEEARIQELREELKVARDDESSAKTQVKAEENDFATQVKAFGECSAPEFHDVAGPTETEFSSDFATCVEEYRKMEQELRDVNSKIVVALQRLEVALGPDYAGSDESETIQRFREELEALPEQEEVLQRDWQHQLTGLQATFDQVLRSLADIKSAADRLNRDFSMIHISNLATLRMEVQEQTENVGSMRRLARIEQPGLFDESTGFEATISSFRSRFEATPVLRYLH